MPIGKIHQSFPALLFSFLTSERVIAINLSPAVLGVEAGVRSSDGQNVRLKDEGVITEAPKRQRTGL